MNRIFLIALAIIAPLFAAAAEKVRIQLNWIPEPEFGGIYEAREDGSFSKHNLDVEIRPGGPGVPVWQQVAQNRVEFGVVSADEVLIADSKGADLVAIFTIYQTNPQGIMSHAERGFTKLEDVFTHPGTLAIEPGLPYTEYLKNKYGFGQLKIVPYAGGITQFLADENFSQQCFVTSEPLAAKDKGAKVTTFLIAESGYNPYTGVVVTTRSYLDQHRAQVAEMVAALREGWRAYLDDPKRANEAMAKLNKNMDLATFAAAAEANKPLIEMKAKDQPLGSMTKERWETLAQQLVELKVTKSAPKAEDVFLAQ